MNIILLTNFCKRHRSLDLCLTSLVVWTSMIFIVFGALVAWGGYEMGQHNQGAAQMQAASLAVRTAIVSERDSIILARQETRASMDALAIHVAKQQAHLMRLDAVGERLVSIGKLDAGEFNFSNEPALGGLDGELYAAGGTASQAAADLQSDLEHLSKLLADRDKKLVLLEDLLLDRKLMAEVVPSGRPLNKGWLSSNYGKRTDPFTGKKTYHHGLDFAGKQGTDVIAVAAGVVTRSEKESGYGNLVEIRHADGYLTRYAHNQKNLVKAGEIVEKGQTIALLGSTGRSNGPHVHFEVRKNDRTVNPKKFIKKG